MGILEIGRDLVLAAGDILAGRRRRRYEHWIDIAAPRELVWRMLKSRDIVFEGRFPVRVVGEPVAGRPGLERIHIIAGSTRLQMLTRIVEERDGRALLYEVLPEGTDTALIEGGDDYIGLLLQDIDGGTRLELVRETSPVSALARLTVPMGLRSGALRYKRKAEAMLARGEAGAPEMGRG